MVAQEGLPLRNSWKVESFTEPGKYYTVEKFGDEWVCSCPQYQNRHVECKHIKKVKEAINFEGENKKPQESSDGKFEPRCKNGHLLSSEVSALQKTIRRGEEYKAAYFAYSIHFSGFGKYLWRRLNVICCEDIGMSSNVIIFVNSLRQMWEFNSKSTKNPTMDDFLFPLQAVLGMCRVTKVREGDSLGNLIAEDYKEGRHIPIPEYAKDPHTKEGKAKWGRWTDGTKIEKFRRIRKWFDEWSKVFPAAKTEDKYVEELKKRWGYYDFTEEELKQN